MDNRLRVAILKRLRERGSGKTICPSEAARVVYSEDWRNHMDSCRREAIQLAHEGKIEICQKGKAVDPDHFKGAIRLRKVSSSAPPLRLNQMDSY